MSVLERGDASKQTQGTIYEVQLSFDVDSWESVGLLMDKLEGEYSDQTRLLPGVIGVTLTAAPLARPKVRLYRDLSGGNASSEIPELLTEPPRDS